MQKLVISTRNIHKVHEIQHILEDLDIEIISLLDLEDPSKIIVRSDEALFRPEAAYETKGFFGNVVFSNGMVELDGRLLVYYGAADSIAAGAETTVDEVLGTLGF